MSPRVLPFGTILLTAAVLLLPAAANAAPSAPPRLSQDIGADGPAAATAWSGPPPRVATAQGTGRAGQLTSRQAPSWQGLSWPAVSFQALSVRAPGRQAPARPGASGRASLRDAPGTGRPRWSPPVASAPISQPFGRPDPGYAAGYHTGVDFAVGVGTPVLAVADATVRAAGPGGEYGKEVKLTLPDGKIALYAHLSRIGVHTGQTVTAGARIGASGDTGNSTGPHLHFEIRTADAYGAVIDPLPYLLAKGAALPVHGNDKAPGE